MLHDLARIKPRKTGRASSWDTSGRNDDWWVIPAGEAVTLAEIDGPGQITHLWMTQSTGYRECLLRFYWDGSDRPSIDVPLGDFFCLGHGLVSNFESLLFSASTVRPHEFDRGCALNAYLPMPFREHAKVEFVNQGEKDQHQYFYVDYETWDATPDGAMGYAHAEFRRTNPFGGWGHDIKVNTPDTKVVNEKRQAYDHNYVIVETAGRGHYLGCNLSVTNFQETWWGEGDDMIWVDGYKWPPDLHGTGSEDYLGQAWGMQDNAFMRNGSSIHERMTVPGAMGKQHYGGYQTSYVFHPENPVHFTESIKVTIEHGHANHLCNEMSSVGYWYADRPSAVVAPPPVAKRMPVLKDNRGHWILDKKNQCPGKPVPLTPEMKRVRKRLEKEQGKRA